MHRELLEELSEITEEEKAILEGQPGINTSLYSKKKEMVIEGDKLLGKGKLISVRPHTRFIHFPKHRHDYVEVVYMCKGSTTHIIDGTHVVLKEGDLLFLNQNCMQEIEAAKETDIAVNFIILPQFFDTAFSMLKGEENPLKDFLIGTRSGSGGYTAYLYFHVADILPVQNLVENMIWTIFYDMSNKRSSNQVTMGLLMLHLLNHMDKMELGSNLYAKELIGQVFSYIEDHYSDGSLLELANEMGYDMYWLSREIKKRTGKTYKELLLGKRMEQASYLLKNTNLPITDIIESVGYNNSSYFYRKFAERYKVGPKEYRENG